MVVSSLCSRRHRGVAMLPAHCIVALPLPCIIDMLRPQKKGRLGETVFADDEGTITLLPYSEAPIRDTIEAAEVRLACTSLCEIRSARVGSATRFRSPRAFPSIISYPVPLRGPVLSRTSSHDLEPC